MIWTTRELTYQGNSAISLTSRERSCFHLKIGLSLINYPYPSYLNYDWNPPRGHYGRLTGFNEGSGFAANDFTQDVPLHVVKSENVYYPRTVVYDRQLDLGRIQTMLGSGFNRVLENQDDAQIPPITYSEETAIEFVYWLLTRALLDSSPFSDEGGIRGHTPTSWALATPRDAIWRWNISSFLSDDIATTDRPIDGGETPGNSAGEGDILGALNDSYPMPEPSGDPIATAELDFPPAGSDQIWFTQVVPTGFSSIAYDYEAYDCSFAEGPVPRERVLTIEASATATPSIVYENGDKRAIVNYEAQGGASVSQVLIDNSLCRARLTNVRFIP